MCRQCSGLRCAANRKQFLRAESTPDKKQFKGAKEVCLDLSQKTELNDWSGRADDFRTFVPLSVSSEILKPIRGSCHKRGAIMCITITSCNSHLPEIVLSKC